MKAEQRLTGVLRVENGFLLAQIIGFCAMCCAIIAMQLKNPRNLIKCYIPVGILWGVQYVLLRAYQGALFSFSAAVKDCFLAHIKDHYVTTLICLFFRLYMDHRSLFHS